MYLIEQNSIDPFPAVKTSILLGVKSPKGFQYFINIHLSTQLAQEIDFSIYSNGSRQPTCLGNYVEGNLSVVILTFGYKCDINLNADYQAYDYASKLIRHEVKLTCSPNRRHIICRCRLFLFSLNQYSLLNSQTIKYASISYCFHLCSPGMDY